MRYLIPQNKTTAAPSRAGSYWVKLLLLSPLFLAAFLVPLRPVRIGDGVDYLLSTVAIATTHHPFITPAVMSTYNSLLEKQPMIDGVPASPATFYIFPQPIPTVQGLSYDATHFWFIGLLTAPCFWIARALHLHFAHSYTLLFAFLWSLLFATAWRTHQAPGLITAVILLFFSPALWFIDKAHTESLTVLSVTAAVIFLSARRLPVAIFVSALAATQNPALSVITLLLLAFWTWELRFPRFRFTDCLWVFAAIGLSLLSPAYYYFRHGAISPIISSGYSNSSFISLRKIVSVFIDPDLGLYPNWPMGLLILLAALVAAFLWRARLSPRSCWEKCGKNLPLTCAIVVYLLIMPTAHASQVNVNGGGTIHVSRYALWYIPLHYLLLLFLLRSVPRTWPRSAGSVALAVAAGSLFASAALFNVLEFKPGGPEVYMEHSPAGLLVYNIAPGIFDPLPEVFIRRSSPLVDPGAIPLSQHHLDPRKVRIGDSTAYDQRMWAFGMPGCRKLYVLSEMLHAFPQIVPGIPKPIGCSGPVSGPDLYEIALRHASPAGDFYLSLSSADYDAAISTMHVGRLIVPSTMEGEAFLGEGWSGPEPGFRWTDGPQASIGFRIDPKEVSGRPLVFLLDTYAYTQHVPRQIAIFQGDGAGTFSWGHDEQKIVEIPVKPDTSGKVMILIHILYPLPKHTIPDPRALGLCVRSMELVTR